MYRPLIFCFVLFAYSQCMQTQDEIDEKNINEDEQSVSLRDQIKVTVGNDECVGNNGCGFFRYKNSWCIIPGSWDYCCIGPCEKDSTGQFMSCDVGARRAFCGEPGRTTVSGHACVAWHPCGLHGTGDYFWCYTSNRGRWDYCCSPLSSCSSDGKGNNMCVMKHLMIQRKESEVTYSETNYEGPVCLSVANGFMSGFRPKCLKSIVTHE
ncbi:hypothetical protein CHS0354_015221 [Potamilus streckersoni]|uniref:Uncharacterized protein n=1 Tax=Potamilus streckersoni TaxID=2493646 RepID=A0AAE0VHK3_9BIVA|nr:hypothetical protein CHS0354_015221 [Potamilus streckersoni]